MLSFFQWSICLPTSCYLTELLLPHCLLPSDKQHGENIYNFKTVKEDLQLVVKEMMDTGLQEESMMLVMPSIMACSILQASRRVCGLTPSWPYLMEELTRYTSDQLEMVTDSLISLHKLHGEEALGVDEGYHSNMSVGYSPEKW